MGRAYTGEERRLDDTEEEPHGHEALVVGDTAGGGRNAGPDEGHAAEVQTRAQLSDNHVGGDLTEDITMLIVSKV